jgi:hypothetical protein
VHIGLGRDAVVWGKVTLRVLVTVKLLRYFGSRKSVFTTSEGHECVERSAYRELITEGALVWFEYAFSEQPRRSHLSQPQLQRLLHPAKGGKVPTVDVRLMKSKATPVTGRGDL